MVFSRSQAVGVYGHCVFRVIASTAVAVIVLTQADQYFYQGRYTGAALFIFHKIALSLGIGY